jgi:signal transduction histidine kinase
MSEALKGLRTLSYLMYPPVLQDHGLRETIRQYIDGYARRSQLEVRFKSNPKADRLPFREQQLLYRIIQEALANIHPHAAASYVSVDLRWISNRLHLIIGDNGSGVGCRAQYGESEFFRTGVGIRAIRARVHLLGGDLKIRTGSLGTKIHVAMPAVG